ncbi:hypothetical protein BU17DRAFT_81899 [Hysterangium stoloniferum]|nr:hypothetical protein BU17DRAFT_84817 [Hysterangium stoloniferum]KAF8527646.1 hypothetical protein BU17DRAFT_81896 [Hysterangium stoloniferum]KAF8527649.1 hypothetical protein BU17DRAFT_81899 [Hysterangium stoloniferum]
MPAASLWIAARCRTIHPATQDHLHRRLCDNARSSILPSLAVTAVLFIAWPPRGDTSHGNKYGNAGNFEQSNVGEWEAEIIDLTSFPGNKSGWETESKGLPPVVADATAPESGRDVVEAGSEKLVAALDCEASELLASEPQNHCIPVFEVIEIPKDESIVVLVLPNFPRLLECEV